MAIIVDSNFKPSDPMGLYKGKSNPFTVGQTKTLSSLAGNPNTNFDTPLTDKEEAEFQRWKQQYAPQDSGDDYDLRGAFKAGVKPDPTTQHFPDTFKKPNHPTFSTESQYAPYAPDLAGTWDEQGNYVPSPKRAQAEAAANAAAQSAAAQDQFTELDAKSPGRYRLMSSSEYDAYKQEWEKKNRSEGLLGDSLRLLNAGYAGLDGNINTLIGMIPGIGKPLQQFGDMVDHFMYGSSSMARWAASRRGSPP